VKTITIIATLVVATALVRGLPPVQTPKDSLVGHSEVVAIVTVANVTEQVVGKRKRQVRKQRADATVERILKGTAPQKFVLAYDEPVSNVSCRPPSLCTGRLLVFLRRDGDVFVRTHAWYSQHRIETNHVNWFLQRPEPFDEAVKEVERIVKSQ